MRYDHGHLVRLFEKKAARGEPTPLEDLPDLDEDEMYVWQCFLDLHAVRPSSGFGASAIPITEIVAYFDIHCIYDWEIKQWLYNLIRALDAHWLGWARSQSKEDPKHGRAGKTNSNRDRRKKGKKRS